MSPETLPGWLLKRARESGGALVHVLLAPATPHDEAIYLLETKAQNYELHCVDDADTGIDGCTFILPRRQAVEVLNKFVGALSGRHLGVEVKALPPAPVPK